jgi:transcriptional regulator with XRE-family HTH domain
MTGGGFGEALRRWRDRVTPQSAGLPVGGRRRAAGLRREELALLAGVSVDYVTRLEQGRASSPSVQVVTALARALRLSDDERRHLMLLAGQAEPGPGAMSVHLTPSVQRLLDRLTGTPVSVYDAAWTLLFWNPMWAALCGDPSGGHGRDRSLPWRLFTGGVGRIVHTPEQSVAFERAIVGDLRAATGRYPRDEQLRRLVADLVVAGQRIRGPPGVAGRGGDPTFDRLVTAPLPVEPADTALRHSSDV